MAYSLIPLGRSQDPRLRELASVHDTVFAASFGDCVDQQCVPVGDLIGYPKGGTALWPHGLELDGEDDSLVIPSTFGLTAAVDYMITVGVTIPTTSDNGMLVKVGNGSSGVGLGIGVSDADTAGNSIVSLDETIRWRTSGFSAGTGFHTLSLFIRTDGARSHYYYKDGAFLAQAPQLGSPPEITPVGETSVGGYGGSSRHFRGQIHFVVVAKNRNQGSSTDMDTLMSAANALYPPGVYVPHTALRSTFYSLPSGPISVSWSSLTASNITQTGARLTLGGITR